MYEPLTSLANDLKDAPLHDILVCHINIVSLPKNFEKIKDFLKAFTRLPEVICFSETRINQKFNKLSLDGYTFYNYNSHSKAGGAGIFVSDKLHCLHLATVKIKSENCEDVWIKVTTRYNNSLIIGSGYRHPRHDITKFQEAFMNII